MEAWREKIIEVVESLGNSFDSHLVIKELAHKNQRLYVQALAAINTDTPFQQLHASLGKQIKTVCESLGFTREDSRSTDLFGQESLCQRYVRSTQRPPY